MFPIWLYFMMASMKCWRLAKRVNQLFIKILLKQIVALFHRCLDAGAEFQGSQEDLRWRILRRQRQRQEKGEGEKQRPAYGLTTAHDDFRPGGGKSC